MTPRVVVTGTGRSGTAYLARVLRAAGVPAGHEAWWNPLDEREDGLLVDVSWCALPLGVEGEDVLVCHQVRHPLDVIASLGKTPTHEPWRALQLQLMPWDPLDPIEWGMLAWFSYVEAAERLSVATWRLDDVGVNTIQLIGELVGVEVPEEDAVRALEATPRDLNWHGVGERYGWVDLPAGGLRDSIMAWAKSWGWQ